MEHTHEQTVSAIPDKKSGLLLVLAWAVMAALALAAILFTAGIFGTNADGALSVSWLSAVCMLICLAATILIWRLKDRLRTEYDYAITEGRLEVTAVLNNRRRVPKLRLELGRILACGQGNAPQGKVEKLYLTPQAKLCYICYEEKGEKKTALLELNEDMTALLKNSRELQRGAWRG